MVVRGCKLYTLKEPFFCSANALSDQILLLLMTKINDEDDAYYGEGFN